MIDMHSHIIWGIDDGAKSEKDTIDMLKRAEASGTTKIVATPHFARGVYEVEFEEVKNKVNELRALAKENNINIEIYHGQEVYYTEKIYEYYKEGYIGTINDTRYMLIEFSLRDFHIDKVIDDLYELTLRGIKIIIAHPERYNTFINEPSLINKFIEQGYLFQLNGGSVTGQFGRRVKKLSKLYLDNNIYSVIGSDGHNDINRSTDISEALKQLTEQQIKSFKINGKNILSNKEVDNLCSYVNKGKKFIKIFSKKWK